MNVLFALGHIQEIKGDNSRALEFFKEALVYDPEDQGVVESIEIVEKKIERNSTKSIFGTIKKWIK